MWPLSFGSCEQRRAKHLAPLFLQSYQIISWHNSSTGYLRAHRRYLVEIRIIAVCKYLYGYCTIHYTTTRWSTHHSRTTTAAQFIKSRYCWPVLLMWIQQYRVTGWVMSLFLIADYRHTRLLQFDLQPYKTCQWYCSVHGQIIYEQQSGINRTGTESRSAWYYVRIILLAGIYSMKHTHRSSVEFIQWVLLSSPASNVHGLKRDCERWMTNAICGGGDDTNLNWFGFEWWERLAAVSLPLCFHISMCSIAFPGQSVGHDLLGTRQSERV